MPTQVETNPFPYSDTNKRYHTYDYFTRKHFGAKCAKLTVDGGFTCPNRDGTVGNGGCIYCSARGSGDFCPDSKLSVREQLERGFETVRTKWPNSLGIAYFQAFTNTYAPVTRLRELFESALEVENIVGLSIATRADCLQSEVCDLLAELAERTHLTVELGLQSVHDKTAEYINRGHSFADFTDGFRRLRAASPRISICVHLIDGLPNETHEMMLESACKVAELNPEQVKIHLLHVIEGTRLAELYREGTFECQTLAEYVDIVVHQLELFAPECVIGRLTGDANRSELVAPLWSLKKTIVLNEIDKAMVRRNTWQGRKH